MAASTHRRAERLSPVCLAQRGSLSEENGMNISARKADERVEAVYFTRSALVVDLVDGRTISVPLQWYPRLLNASSRERANWEKCGGGYGIHWPEIDEDLSTRGLLLGSPTAFDLPPQKAKGQEQADGNSYDDGKLIEKKGMKRDCVRGDKSKEKNGC